MITGRDTPPAFARSARPSIFGKRTELVRGRISSDSQTKLTEAWRAAGYANQSEYVSEWLEIHLNGPDHVLKVHEGRIARLVGIGREKSAH